MELFYWKSRKGNFGDDLNDWLWDSLLPGFRDWATDVRLIGVGTILHAGYFPASEKTGRYLVAGSGVGYGMPPDTSDTSRWDIRSLRGPRSASALGLSGDLGMIDPAVMLSELDMFTGLATQGRPIFIPHISSVDRFDWPRICTAAGIDYVSPCGDSHEVIRRIASAPLVLGESMHAAIIADTFRVPWIAVSLSSTFNAAKWHDWSESLEIPLKIHPMFPLISRLSDPRGRKRAAAERGQTRMAEQPAATGVAHKSRPRISWKRRLRTAAESLLARRSLRRIAGIAPQLSDKAILDRQKHRYRAVLDAIARDYG